jgi:hypothetical protein
MEPDRPSALPGIAIARLILTKGFANPFSFLKSMVSAFLHPVVKRKKGVGKYFRWSFFRIT